jgi:O-methyltransferase involved in polyketide biosynthesis
MVARTLFIGDSVADPSSRGVNQCVILGAGLDSLGQRRPEIASCLNVLR